MLGERIRQARIEIGLNQDETMPSASELLRMPEEEREKWIQLSFVLAANEDFEIFESFKESS